MEEDGEIINLVYQSGPVTALKVIDDILLAGIGSHLHVYELKTSRRIQVIRGLPHQNIHGISQATSVDDESSENLLCVFGEKTFQIVNFDQQTKRISKTCKPLEIRDWIWDVQWLKSAEDSTYDCLALVTGHNCIIRIDWKSAQPIDRIQCEEQCILYCAHFIGSRWDHLVLAAGTVFNQIILWAPTANQTPSEDLIISKPFQRLTGHQGVIFSIHYHEAQKRICSASDDRSIRVWQLHFARGPENDPSILDWQDMVSECIHTLYGHQARVWRAQLTSTGLTSIGEDATCCIWNDEGKIRQKFKGHKGKSIWSMAINRKEDLVVTGGGDSSIRVWSVHLDLCARNVSSKQLDISSFEPKTENPNFPRIVTHLNFNTVLILTNSGTLYHYCLSHSAWATVMEDPTFFSYSCLAVSNKTSTIAVGNLSGTIRLFRPSEETLDDSCLCNCKYINCELPKCYEGKVFNLLWIGDTYLLTTGPEGLMILYLLDSRKSSSFSLEQLHQFILPQSKQRWATSACLLPTKGLEIESLVCGDRNGSVHLYSIQPDEQQAHVQRQSFYRIHGKAGVTDICSHKGYVYTAGRDGQYRQFNLAEDNTLQLLNSNKVFKGFEWIDQLLFNDDDELLILGFHSANFLVWSCAKSQKLLEISCGGGHRGWGCRLRDDQARFVYIKARDVVICEAKIPSNQKVLKPSHHGRQQTNIKHLFSRTNSKGQEYHVCVTCSDDTTVQVVELTYDHSKNMDLKILLVLPGHISSVQTLFCLRSPTPACWEGGQSYLLFSAGGRAQFNGYRLTFLAPNDQDDDDDKRTVCIPEQLCTEFLVKRLPKHWAAKNLTVDPETRIMGLTAFYGHTIYPEIPPSIIFVGMACSDGSVRLFSFNEESRKLHPLWTSSASNGCVLQITHFVHSEDYTNSSTIFLLSAATDGHICFWEITSICHSLLNNGDAQPVTNSQDFPCSSRNDRLTNLLETLSNDGTVETDKKNKLGRLLINPPNFDSKAEADFTIAANTSGINSLHVKQFPDGHYILTSGGDDNAFFVTSFTISPDNPSTEEELVTCRFSLKNQFGHAAQITGIHILNEHFIITSSIDQRICIWQLQSYESEQKYTCVLCRYVEVADLSDMEVWKSSNHLYIGVCGAGLCVLSINLEYFDDDCSTSNEKGVFVNSSTSTRLVKCP